MVLPFPSAAYFSMSKPICGMVTVKVLGSSYSTPPVTAVEALVEKDPSTVVCPPAEREAFERALSGIPVPLRFVDGGDTRQASVAHGLSSLPEECTHVLVHDGARPLVDEETIRAAMASAQERGSGVAAVPLVDTVKRADGEGLVLDTPDRACLRGVQTPQCFRLSLLRE